MTTIDTQSEIEAFAGRIFENGLATIELFSVYLGLRLGLYTALANGPCTASELAATAGVDVRYAREWLEQQTVAGNIACRDRNAAANDRTFELPIAHATVLLDPDHPACSAPIALAAAGCASVLPELLDAYRSGGGVPYARYGTDFRNGQAGFNRPAFVHLLADSWLVDGAPQAHQVLVDSTSPRIADVACGAGWSAISLARAYPRAHVDGFDIDDASIADARRNVADTGLTDRVRFEVRDAADLSTGSDGGNYDLVTIFEALHDMGHPVEALRSCRALCAPSGSVIVMDERTAESFAESEGPVERFLYGVSLVHCLPVGLSERDSVGTGTVMRADTMRAYADAAGFSDCVVLPIEHDLYRFYQLIP